MGWGVPRYGLDYKCACVDVSVVGLGGGLGLGLGFQYMAWTYTCGEKEKQNKTKTQNLHSQQIGDHSRVSGLRYLFCLVAETKGPTFRGIPGFYSISGAVDYTAVIFFAHLVALKCEFSQPLVLGNYSYVLGQPYG